MDEAKDEQSSKNNIKRNKRNMGLILEMAHNLINANMYAPAILNFGKIAIPLLTHFVNQVVLNMITKRNPEDLRKKYIKYSIALLYFQLTRSTIKFISECKVISCSNLYFIGFNNQEYIFLSSSLPPF